VLSIARKGEKLGIFRDVLKDLAKATVSDVMVSAAQNEQEESISLVRHAGSADEKNLNVKVDINCARATLPLYVCRIIESAARVSDVSYENMVKIASVYHELAGEVSDQTFDVKEGDHDED
jgi:hypothetical protein